MKTSTRRLTYYLISLLLLLQTGCREAGIVDPTYAGGADAATQRQGLPSHYSAEAINGKVVDAETKAPLEDAIVIAIWELKRAFGREGPIPSEHMQVTEVLTDTQGNYHIPAWGPKVRPEGAYLGRSDPLIVVFKPAYVYKVRTNYYVKSADDNRYEAVHHSYWNGKTVALKKFEGDLKAYYERLSRLDNVLGAVFNRTFGAGNCDWQKIPQMMIVFDRYDQLLKKAKLPRSGIPSLDVLVKRKECNIVSKEAFIEEHK